MIKKLDESLQKLEEIVAALEKGDNSLEYALSLFESGIKLTKQCQQALAEAEQKVETLSSTNNQEETE